MAPGSEWDPGRKARTHCPEKEVEPAKGLEQSGPFPFLETIFTGGPESRSGSCSQVGYAEKGFEMAGKKFASTLVKEQLEAMDARRDFIARNGCTPEQDIARREEYEEASKRWEAACEKRASAVKPGQTIVFVEHSWDGGCKLSGRIMSFDGSEHVTVEWTTPFHSEECLDAQAETDEVLCHVENMIGVENIYIHDYKWTGGEWVRDNAY